MSDSELLRESQKKGVFSQVNVMNKKRYIAFLAISHTINRLSKSKQGEINRARWLYTCQLHSQLN